MEWDNRISKNLGNDKIGNKIIGHKQRSINNILEYYENDDIGDDDDDDIDDCEILLSYLRK